MIEEPPLLTVKEHRNRPSVEQIEALRGTPTGFLTDAMNGRGALDHVVYALSPSVLSSELCGPALTCHCGPADILAILGGLNEIQAGDVMVVATGGWTQSAVTGDRVMGMLKNAGGAGFVTDGVVRDVDGIEEVGLPLMCCGVSPNSPFAKGPGEIGLPIQLAGVSVNSGDMIVSDRSGVVVVPFERIDEVIEAIARIRVLEDQMDAEVAQGLKLPEHIKAMMQADQVRRV
jgi:4-hydroxy-4-methyl-2-oxoglutarate aldolase